MRLEEFFMIREKREGFEREGSAQLLPFLGHVAMGKKVARKRVQAL